MYFFDKPGFCWNGESAKGKYRICIDTVYSSFKLSTDLTFDSVYVYKQRFYESADSSIVRYFVSSIYPIVVKKENWLNESLTEIEYAVAFSKK